MKKRIWLGLLAVLAIAVSVSWGWYERQARSPLPQVEVTVKRDSSSWDSPLKNALSQVGSKAAAEASPPIDAPQVEIEKVFEDIKALNFERYTEGDRLRTREYIWNVLTAAGFSPQLQEFETGINVWAKRDGTEPSEGAILVGAHYDTVPGSPGADDNATGVAGVLEVARLLGKRQTARSLWVAFFDEEELGLRGSLAFTAGENLPLDELRGAIILDMIGYACRQPGCQQYPKGLPAKPPSDKGDFLAVVGDIEHRPLLDAFEGGKAGDGKNVASNSTAVFTLPVPLKGVLIPDVLRSDHAPFWYKGIGAVLVTDTANLRSPHYHEPSDTPETLDWQFFADSVQLVVNAATVLLESKGSLQTAPSGNN